MSWLDGFLTQVFRVFGAGVELTNRSALDFYGSGVSVADDPTTQRTRITIPGATSNNYTPAPALIATTANVTLSGLQTIDGVSPGAGARVLALEQTSAAENGLWIMQSSSWTRPSDFDAGSTVRPGTVVFVRLGTANGGIAFRLASTGTLTVDASDLEFTSTLDRVGATVRVGGEATDVELVGASVSIVDADGGTAIIAVPDADGLTVLAANEEVTALLIGQPGIRTGIGAHDGGIISIASQDGQEQTGGANNTSGGPIKLEPGDAGFGGSGDDGKPGYIALGKNAATIGAIRTGHPGDFDGVLLAKKESIGSGSRALITVGNANEVTWGDIGTGDVSIASATGKTTTVNIGGGVRLSVSETAFSASTDDSAISIDATTFTVSVSGAPTTLDATALKLADGVASLEFKDATTSVSIGQPTLGGTGASAGRNAILYAQAGQAQAGGADNNDGGSYTFKSGAAGTGGAGAAGVAGHFVWMVGNEGLFTAELDVNNAKLTLDGSRDELVFDAGAAGIASLASTATAVSVSAKKVDAGSLFLDPLGAAADDFPRLLDPSTGVLTLAAADGRSVTLRAGEWTCDSTYDAPDRLVLRCEPGVSIVSTQATAMSYPGTYLFFFESSGTVQSGSLAATPAIGATTLSVSTTVKPVVGHFLQISHGLSCTTFEVVAASGGASPWSVTIDRPTLLPWASGDVVDEFTARPSYCSLDFGGASAMGPGNQYVQGVRADHVAIAGLRQISSGSNPNNAVGFDNACVACSAEDCSAEGNGTDALTGFYSQSGEHVDFRRLSVKRAADTGYGVVLLDCVQSTIEDCVADRCGNGLVLTAFAIAGPDTSLGCYECSIFGGMAVDCISGAVVGLQGPARNCSVTNFSAVKCSSYGIYVGAGAVGTKIDRCTIRKCTVGVIVQEGSADTKISELRIEDGTDIALSLACHTDITSLTVVNNNNAAAVVQIGGSSSPVVRLRGAALEQVNGAGYGIYYQAGGRLEIDGCRITGANTVGIWLNDAACYATARNLTIGASGQGIYVVSGATLILGGNVDLSACTAPFTLFSGCVVLGRFDAATSTIAMTTANHTATWAEFATDAAFITGTLGAGRDLKIPCYRIPQTFVNNADQTVTVKAVDYAGTPIGSGLAIAAGATKRGVFDGSNYVQVG